jgi:hypothetical protein
MLHQINTRTHNSERANAISRTILMDTFAKLVLHVIQECSLTSAEYVDEYSKQAHRDLCKRDFIDFPSGARHKIICMGSLQRTPVGGGPL